jgi:HEAT repeats
VAECARLIRDGKARGTWADIIAYEFAENASECLVELIDTFRTDPNESVRQYVMMALDIARLPQSVPFLAEVLREGNPVFTPYALRALDGIDTRESRTALWHATHSQHRRDDRQSE